MERPGRRTSPRPEDAAAQRRGGGDIRGARNFTQTRLPHDDKDAHASPAPGQSLWDRVPGRGRACGGDAWPRVFVRFQEAPSGQVCVPVPPSLTQAVPPCTGPSATDVLAQERLQRGLCPHWRGDTQGHGLWSCWHVTAPCGAGSPEDGTAGGT